MLCTPVASIKTYVERNETIKKTMAKPRKNGLSVPMIKIAHMKKFNT